MIAFADARLLPIVRDTALARCTTTTLGPDGYTVTTRWPSISTGERILWDWLDHAAKGERIPDDLFDKAVAHLDRENLHVLAGVSKAVAA